MLFILLHSAAVAQDTIHLAENIKIVCKITRITETEVEYKKTNNTEGPIYSLKKYHIKKIVFANGTTESMAEFTDPLKVKYVRLTNAVKLDLFAPLFNKVTVGFEHYHNSGWNSELYLSLIKRPLLNYNSSDPYYDNDAIQGIGLKYGLKFILGGDRRVRGTNYAHPLKGMFIRADIGYNQYSILNGYYVETIDYNYLYHYGSINVSAFSLGISTGVQFTIGNSFLLQGNIGMGYYGGFSNFKESYTSEFNEYNHVRYRNGNINYGVLLNFVPLGIRSMYLSGNITLGYVIGDKAEKYKIRREKPVFED